jgi:hypothetical protein
MPGDSDELNRVRTFEGAAVCGVLTNERWNFAAVRSNVVRLPPLPSVGAEAN